MFNSETTINCNAITQKLVVIHKTANVVRHVGIYEDSLNKKGNIL